MSRNGAPAIILIYMVIMLLVFRFRQSQADANSASAGTNLYSTFQNRLNATSNFAESEYDLKTSETMGKIYDLVGRILHEQLKQQQQERKDDSRSDDETDEEDPAPYHEILPSNAADVAEKYPEPINTQVVGTDVNQLDHRQTRAIRKASRRFCPRPHRAKKSYFSETNVPRGEDRIMRKSSVGGGADDWQLSPLSSQPEARESAWNLDDDDWRYRRSSRRKGDLEGYAVDGISDSDTNRLTGSIGSTWHGLPSDKCLRNLRIKAGPKSLQNSALKPKWADKRMQQAQPPLPMPVDDSSAEEWKFPPISTKSDGDGWRFKRGGRKQCQAMDDERCREIKSGSRQRWTVNGRVNMRNSMTWPYLLEDKLIKSDDDVFPEDDKLQREKRSLIDTFPKMIESPPLIDTGPLSANRNYAIKNDNIMLTEVPEVLTNPVARGSGQKFNYDNPNKWFLISRQCGGVRQSPIALFTKKTFTANLAPLSFKNYDVPLSSPIRFSNNGHTAEVNINTTRNGSPPSISGGGINDVYEAIDIHFHWGSRTTKGSEHAINAKRYDLEMHIVHKNVKFPTLGEALKDPFGLAVLGVLFKKSERSDRNSTGLNAIYDALPSISEAESMQFLNQTITMNSFLADLNTQKFFTYRGSLTTPPCAETVTWFVFPDVVPIQAEDLERFFTLYDDRDLPLLNTVRPLQATFLRRVYYQKGSE